MITYNPSEIQKFTDIFSKMTDRYFCYNPDKNKRIIKFDNNTLIFTKDKNFFRNNIKWFVSEGSVIHTILNVEQKIDSNGFLMLEFRKGNIFICSRLEAFFKNY